MLAWLFGSVTRPPVLLKLRSSQTFVILTVASAVFTDMFCYGIIVPVLPFALASRANINPERIQVWISIFLAVYGAALLVTAPICGWLADRSSSRQMPLLIGLLALGGSTSMLCVGSSIAILTAGRVLQGISAAVVWVVGLAVLVDTVGPDHVGQAVGYVGVSMSLGMLLAPLLGGIVFDTAGYYAVFAMAFGLIVLDILMRVFMIEKKVAAKWKSELEVEQTQTQGTSKDVEDEVGVDALKSPDGAERPISLDAIPAKAASPAEEEAANVEPVPPPTSATGKFIARLPPVVSLLASRRVCNAIWASTMAASLYGAFEAITPLFVRDTFNWSSVGAGLIFLPIILVSFSGPLVGWLSDKHGPRWYATAGFVLSCPFLVLLRLVKENTLEQKVLLCALLALTGICLTLVITPIMAEITYAVDAKARRRPPGYFGKNGAYAQAYSLFNVAWAAGCLIGPLLGGLVNEAHGWATTTLILGLVSLATAVPTTIVIWTGGSIFKKIKARKAEQRAVNERMSTPC